MIRRPFWRSVSRGAGGRLLRGAQLDGVRRAQAEAALRRPYQRAHCGWLLQSDTPEYLGYESSARAPAPLRSKPAEMCYTSP